MGRRRRVCGRQARATHHNGGEGGGGDEERLRRVLQLQRVGGHRDVGHEDEGEERDVDAVGHQRHLAPRERRRRRERQEEHVGKVQRPQHKQPHLGRLVVTRELVQRAEERRSQAGGDGGLVIAFARDAGAAAAACAIRRVNAQLEQLGAICVGSAAGNEKQGAVCNARAPSRARVGRPPAASIDGNRCRLVKIVGGGEMRRVTRAGQPKTRGYLEYPRRSRVSPRLRSAPFTLVHSISDVVARRVGGRPKIQRHARERRCASPHRRPRPPCRRDRADADADEGEYG